MTAWPVPVQGIIETVVTTPQQDGDWAVAALGLHEGTPVTARTWGNTRTRRNFEREGSGVVHLIRDPVLFVGAALGEMESTDAVLPDADAWVRVRATELERGVRDGTTWISWELLPQDATVERESVPVTNRGYNAVIEATVAASRLDVPAYDESVLRERLAYFDEVARRCGGPAVTRAMDRLVTLSEWDPSA
ncbi:MAG: DUF447 domain-containing protein [Halodesulfurarchaeum sp.]